MEGGGGNTFSCPDVAAWLHLAAGMTPETARGGLLEHAAGCAVCALQLRNALAVMSDDSDAAEEAALPQLASSRPEWRKYRAASVAVSPVRELKPARRVPVWQWLAAAAALTLAASGAFWLWTESRPPMTLLARAYTNQRTFELRIPGAVYAPVRVSRGAPSLSADLLHGEAAIQKHLQSTPGDAGWLRAEGRAALLEWRPAEAITALRRALDADPKMSAGERAETLTDLATAHFQRGERDGANEPYATATDLLTQAIALEPAFAPAWYNRAIVQERLGRFPEAASDWRQYLQLDASGPWANDARSRLEALERRAR